MKKNMKKFSPATFKGAIDYIEKIKTYFVYHNASEKTFFMN